jgi:hypothetical protein
MSCRFTISPFTFDLMKTYARIFISLQLLFLLTTISVSGQTEKEPTVGGVYLTLDDYNAGKLTYDIDCSMEKQKIKLHDFLAKPYMDVYYKGEKIRLEKNNVYGFKDCHDQTFRFFDNMEYKLVEAGKIVLYTQDQMILSEKSGKSSYTYFFSTTSNGPVKFLSNINLKAAYPENTTFHNLLDEKINSLNIAEYDSLKKTYRVNLLFLESERKH